MRLDRCRVLLAMGCLHEAVRYSPCSAQNRGRVLVLAGPTPQAAVARDRAYLGREQEPCTSSIPQSGPTPLDGCSRTHSLPSSRTHSSCAVRQPLRHALPARAPDHLRQAARRHRHRAGGGCGGRLMRGCRVNVVRGTQEGMEDKSSTAMLAVAALPPSRRCLGLPPPHGPGAPPPQMSTAAARPLLAMPLRRSSLSVEVSHCARLPHWKQ